MTEWRKDLNDLRLKPVDPETGKRIRLRDVVDRWGPDVARSMFEKVAYQVVRGVSPTRALRNMGVRRGVYQRLRWKQSAIWDEVWETALRGYSGEEIQVEVFKSELSMLDVRRAMLRRAKASAEVKGVDGYDFSELDKQDMDALKETSKAASTLSKHVTALVQKRVEMGIDLNVRRETHIDVNLYADVTDRLDSITDAIAREIGIAAGRSRSVKARPVSDDGDGPTDSAPARGRPALTGSVLEVQEGGAGGGGEGEG